MTDLIRTLRGFLDVDVLHVTAHRFRDGYDTLTIIGERLLALVFRQVHHAAAVENVLSRQGTDHHRLLLRWYAGFTRGKSDALVLECTQTIVTLVTSRMIKETRDSFI